MPLDRCHLSQTLLSMTGTSTACNVFGRSREPGESAPHPADHPNFPKKSSFFSGKQIGAKKIYSTFMFIKYFNEVTHICAACNVQLSQASKLQHQNGPLVV